MKYLIETWGCQMNSHDSEKLEGLLLKEGHEAATGVEEADLVLLNTCSIREKAVQKVLSELGYLAEEKKRRPLLVGVAGCLAQQDQAELFRRAPQIDFVLGTMAIQQLPALVSIIEGCNHACTYCVVPTTRGPERHRPHQDVVDEVRGLVAAGYREVELLGQNVNSFQGGCSFAELLDRVAEVDGLEWIRFTTSHPMNFTPQLARTLSGNPKVAPFLHLPVQSGSDAVLRRMRREYTVAQYLERLGYLGERSADLCLSTDFIVGFPGETDADFQATLDLLEQVKFDLSFSFIYSPRPGTPALRLKDDLPHRVKLERLTRLQARQTELTLASNRRMVGRTVLARIETEAPLDGGHWLARTANWKNIHLLADGRPMPFRELVEVRITDAGPHFLRAELAAR